MAGGATAVDVAVDFDDHAVLPDLTLKRALFFQDEMRRSARSFIDRSGGRPAMIQNWTLDIQRQPRRKRWRRCGNSPGPATCERSASRRAGCWRWTSANAPFARRLLDLAVGYNSKAIVALVEKAPERDRPG